MKKLGKFNLSLVREKTNGKTKKNFSRPKKG